MSPEELAKRGLFGLLIPALVAGIVWGGTWRIWNRSAQPVAGGTWAGALAVGLAMIAGYFGNEEWKGIPPRVIIGWLPFIASATIAAGVIESAFGCMIRRTVLWLFVAGGVAFVLTETPRTRWSAPECVLACTGIAAGIGLALTSVEVLARRWTGLTIPMALWIWTAAIAGALAMTGSLSYGHLGGVLAAIMGAGIVVAAIKPTISFGRGAASAIVVLGGSFLLYGYFYSDLPGSCALILGAAPLALWFGETPVVTKHTNAMKVILRATSIALPVVAALLIAAWPMFFPTPSKNGAPPSAEEMYYK